jgi:predicted NBD/HSP70 family sugar kinase
VIIMQPVAVIIDGGGTNLRSVIIDKDGRVLSRVVIDTNATNYGAARADLFTAIDKLVTSDMEIVIIVFAIAGNTDGKTILACGNLKGWIGMPIAEDLGRRYSCEAVLVNDGHAMAASEFSVQKRSLILGIFGTGVNLLVALDDKILTPNNGGLSFIGEGGHICIVENGHLCGCGMRGCLEAYAGGNGIRHVYKKPAEDLNDMEWGEVLSYMALGLRNIIVLTGGKLPIYLTGGVICRQKDRLSELLRYLEDVRMIIPELPTIQIATHGEDAGINGATIIALHRMTALDV